MVIFSSGMGSKWRSAFSDIACSVARSQARNLGSQVFPSRPGKSASLWFGFLTKPKQRKVRVNFVLWRKVKAIAFHYLGIHFMQNVLSMITYCQKNSHFLSCLDRIDLMCFFFFFEGLKCYTKKLEGKVMCNEACPTGHLSLYGWTRLLISVQYNHVQTLFTPRG